MKAITAPLSGLVIAGCGLDYAGVPLPTSKPVTPKDVIGTWYFHDPGEVRSVRLTFKGDGTFAQEVAAGDGPSRDCPNGRWRLEGPEVMVIGYAGPYGTLNDVWFMIDRPGRPGELALFGGGDKDPDSYLEMTRVGK